MDTVIKWFRTRQANVKQGFIYGESSSSFYSQETTNIIPLFIDGFLRGAIAGGLTWIIGRWGVDSASFKLSDWADYVGMLTMLFYWLIPLGYGIFLNRGKTTPFWRQFSKKYRLFASGVIAFLLLWSTYMLSPFIEPYLTEQAKENASLSSLKKVKNTGSKKPSRQNKQQGQETRFQSSAFFKGQTFLLVTLPLTALGVFGGMQCISMRRKRKPLKLKSFSTKALTTKERPFRLWLGESTGWLAEFGHTTSLAPYQQIGLGLNEATQNILVMGAIGAGKTTRVINPLLLQLLDQDCGGLIFDIKGDFKKAVNDAANMTQKEAMIIGVGQVSLNLLAGLSPEMASSFLKSALLLSGSSNLDSFWTDTATELCRNVLGILSFFPEHYHLRGLYQALFDENFQTLLNDVCQYRNLEESAQRRLSACQHYIKAIFARFDEKIRNGVLASVSQVLSPFQHPELIDTFCTTTPESISMESVLNGQVILIDMPLAQWGLAGKVIYTFIKLRFFNVMQQRALRENWNQNRPVFFMCDEYQEIVSCNKDGLSDLNFWDKSRSSKTIGIISAQSISSFYAAIGNRDLAHALLQNFRQRLCFRVEDDWTISYFNRLLGKVEIEQMSYSENSGYSSRGLLGLESSYHQSSGTSITTQQRDLIDGQLFRNLGSDQVLAFLSIFGVSADDVLNVQPVFMG